MLSRLQKFDKIIVFSTQTVFQSGILIFSDGLVTVPGEEETRNLLAEIEILERIGELHCVEHSNRHVTLEPL